MPTRKFMEDIWFLGSLFLNKDLHGLDLSNLLDKSEEQKRFDREFDLIVSEF